ncbi:GGDEF domain-containing protein [Phenylobacterium terrae]|uniref:diguanylate cyclase n=1 Tax=Phenylobacterium terrae TaxID=2665495 RepID=A0ABW4N3V9_9CAUL
MSEGVDSRLRAHGGYALARNAVDAMEKAGVWPTAVNFELWVNYVADPQSPLAQEIDRLISSGEAFTESVTEQLAAHFLPKSRLTDHIRDAGDQLGRELAAVSLAIADAQKTSHVYGETLAVASRNLGGGVQDVERLKATVDTLSTATQRVQDENRALEARLAESSAEVSRLRDHLEQVRKDATTDGLTNIANRKSFDEKLEQACEDARQTGRPLALAVLDIDHFKLFNDTWGHQTGDQVLRYVASVIGRNAPAPRFCARYGGEEFAVIFTGESAADVYAGLQAMRAEVNSRILKRRSTGEDLGQITLSAGMAMLRPGETPHSLVERADAALYASKRNGRNRVTSAESIANAA